MSSKNPRDPGTPHSPGDPRSPAGAPREARDKPPHADDQGPPGQESHGPLPGADPPPPHAAAPPDEAIREQIRDAFFALSRPLGRNLALYSISLSPLHDEDIVERVRFLRDALLDVVLSYADELSQVNSSPIEPQDPSPAAVDPTQLVTITWLLKLTVWLLRRNQQGGTWDGQQPLPRTDNAALAGLRAADWALDEAQLQLLREHAMSEYFYALDEGDLDTLEMLIERAETDPKLAAMLFDLDARIVEEELGIDLIALDWALGVPGQALTSAMGDERAFTTPSDEPDDLAEAFLANELAVCIEILREASLLSLDDPASIIETVALSAPVEEEDALASRAWDSAPSPLVAPPGALISSLHVPDGWPWRRERGYSSSFARVLYPAYTALARAPESMHAFADAFRALEGRESSQMSARQRARVNYVMGICHAAVGNDQTAVAFFDLACLGARRLGDWGGAAECAYYAALIYAALGDCETAAEYFTMCLDCLDHY